MNPSLLTRTIRQNSGLSLREMAEAAGVAASTIHRIEIGTMHPTVEMLERLFATVGVGLSIEAQPDSRIALVGLAQVVGEDLARGDVSMVVRRASEFVNAFNAEDGEIAMRMVAVEPSTTHDAHWDAFFAALAEWLTVKRQIDTPRWVYKPTRYLERAWWVTPLRSMRAWEYAGSPAAFQSHGVYIHRDSLVNA